eukprot:scaffold131959_cov63-Phaeocystis_antarctica.AAC.3
MSFGRSWALFSIFESSSRIRFSTWKEGKSLPRVHLGERRPPRQRPRRSVTSAESTSTGSPRHRPAHGAIEPHRDPPHPFCKRYPFLRASF